MSSSRTCIQTGFVLAVCLIVFVSVGLTETEKKSTVLVLPFTHINQKYTGDIALQSSWMISKKLKFWRIVEVMEGKHIFGATDGTPNWPELKDAADLTPQLSAIVILEEVEWVVAGRLVKLEVDKDRKADGPAIIGVCKIPVKAVLEVFLYDPLEKQVVWSTEEIIQGWEDSCDIIF